MPPHFAFHVAWLTPLPGHIIHRATRLDCFSTAISCWSSSTSRYPPRLLVEFQSWMFTDRLQVHSCVRQRLWEWRGAVVASACAGKLLHSSESSTGRIGAGEVHNFSIPRGPRDRPHPVAGVPPVRQGVGASPAGSGFTSDELSRAIVLLQSLMQRDEQPPLCADCPRPRGPKGRPGMRMVSVQDTPKTNTGSSGFNRFRRDPTSVRGGCRTQQESRARFHRRGTGSGGCHLPSRPNISPMDAVRAIAVLTEANSVALPQGDAPSLVYFFHDQPAEAWHLCYFVTNVPAVPEELPLPRSGS